MPSIHMDRAMRVAAEKGGFAGLPTAEALWELPKRELVELAIRLGSQAAGNPDDPEAGINAVNDEREALRANGII